MFKVILMIDCNICGEPFDCIATSVDRDPLAWKSLSQDLEDTSLTRGWSFYRSAHHCSYCITDIAYCVRQNADESTRKQS
jgi:hypothetical protein